jgi:hypothetical protein
VIYANRALIITNNQFLKTALKHNNNGKRDL